MPRSFRRLQTKTKILETCRLSYMVHNVIWF